MSMITEYIRDREKQTKAIADVKRLDPFFYMYHVNFVVNGKDIVKEKSEKYFMENVLYHIPDDDKYALAALGLPEKPNLGPEKPTVEKPALRKRIINMDTNATQFYTEYAKFWVPLSILTQDPEKFEYESLKEIKAEIPNKLNDYNTKLNLLNKKYAKVLAFQCHELYSFALVEHFKEAQYYYDRAAKFNFQLQQYLLKPHAMKEWTDRFEKNEDFQAQISALKGRLDFVDPSSKLSNLIVPQYIAYFYLNLFSKDDSLDEEKLNKIIKEVLDIFEKAPNTEPNKPVKTLIQDFKDILTTGNTASGLKIQLLDVVRELFKKDPNTPNALTDPDKFEDKLLAILRKIKLSDDLLKSAKTKLNCIFRLVQFTILGITGKELSTAEKIDPVKVMLHVSEFSIVLTDTLSSFKYMDKALTQLVSEILKDIGKVLPKYLGQVTFKYQTQLALVLTPSVAQFCALRLGPVLLILQGLVSLYDSIDSYKDGVGPFACDLVTGYFGVAGGAGMLALGFVIGGPLAVPFCLAGVLLLGIVMLTISLIKKFKYDCARKTAIKNYLVHLGKTNVETILSADDKVDAKK